MARIESTILELWPNAEIIQFGTVATGLELPNSDLDFMVMNVSEPNGLQTLEAHILARDIAEPNTFLFRDNFRVPVLEFIDRESKIDIDIILYDEPFYSQVTLMNEYKQKYPAFLKMVFVLRQYIKECGLNYGFTGFKLIS